MLQIVTLVFENSLCSGHNYKTTQPLKLLPLTLDYLRPFSLIETISILITPFSPKENDYTRQRAFLHRVVKGQADQGTLRIESDKQQGVNNSATTSKVENPHQVMAHPYLVT